MISAISKVPQVIILNKAVPFFDEYEDLYHHVCKRIFDVDPIASQWRRVFRKGNEQYTFLKIFPLDKYVIEVDVFKKYTWHLDLHKSTYSLNSDEMGFLVSMICYCLLRDKFSNPNTWNIEYAMKCESSFNYMGEAVWTVFGKEKSKLASLISGFVIGWTLNGNKREFLS